MNSNRDRSCRDDPDRENSSSWYSRRYVDRFLLRNARHGLLHSHSRPCIQLRMGCEQRRQLIKFSWAPPLACAIGVERYFWKIALVAFTHTSHRRREPGSPELLRRAAKQQQQGEQSSDFGPHCIHLRFPVEHLGQFSHVTPRPCSIVRIRSTPGTATFSVGHRPASEPLQNRTEVCIAETEVHSRIVRRCEATAAQHISSLLYFSCRHKDGSAHRVAWVPGPR